MKKRRYGPFVTPAMLAGPALALQVRFGVTHR